jgi:hypothetical protein
MSSSSSNTSDLGTLIVEGEPGVEIRVLDGDFTLRARGTVELKADLPPELYMINWKGADGLRQEVVRLRSGQVRTVRSEHTPRPEPSSANATLLSVTEATGHPIGGDSRRADIVVVVDYGTKNPAAPEFRLFSRDEAENQFRSDGRAVKDYRVNQLDGTTACVFHVHPETYRLQYKSLQGETLDQIVPAFTGRRTIVVVRTGVGEVLVKSGEELGTTFYDGIDPTATRTFTVSKEQAADEYAETVRLTSVLLASLATRRTCLGETLLASIEADSADPMLKIYAAATIVYRLETRLSPSLDATFPTDESEQRLFVKTWLKRASKLIAPIQGKGVPADVPVLAWRIRELLGQRSHVMPKIATPPMLECAWRWAMMQSVSSPNNFPKSFSFRSAERGAIGSSPWLVWRAAAAKGGDVADKKTARGTLQDTLLNLAQGAAALVKETGSTLVRPDALQSLSVESRNVVAAALRLLSTSSSTSVIDVAKQLAAATQLPSGTLLALAQQALAEMSGNRADQEVAASGPVVTDKRKAAPALARPILNPDDPQKGRFGGKAEVGGFRLYVRFEETRRDWIDLTLIVASKEPMDDEIAEFFLHDTFKPNRYVEPFNKKRAELTEVRAWGGFTCGVWIPSRNVELELDLAALPRAPRLIREL